MALMRRFCHITRFWKAGTLLYFFSGICHRKNDIDGAAKGFGDSVVFIDGDRCSVVVQAEELQQQESLQILEIVVSQAGVAPEKVQIVTAKT